MRNRRVASVLVLLLIIGGCIPAPENSAPAEQVGLELPADLTNIDRTIVMEPAYQTATPRYCLVVFGPHAETPVWLVLDGDILYVDRNANRDLTEPDERVEARPHPRFQNATQFNGGTIVAKNRVASKTRLELLLADGLTFVYCHTKGRPWQRAVTDREGDLEFGDTAMAAPLIHFNGRLTIRPRFAQPFKRGSEPTELHVMVGTPGLGGGSFARVANDEVPNHINPFADIIFPGEGGQPVTLKTILNRRCCGDRFYAPIRVPAKALDGKARVTVSFPDSTQGTVAPATFEVAVLSQPSSIGWAQPAELK